jgi:hypothetical protein
MTADPITMFPNGHRYELVFASWAKRQLQTDLPAGTKLQLLEQLTTLSHDWLTAKMIEHVEPMDDVSAQMWEEAKSLDRQSDHGASSYKAIVQRFRHFCQLNPSLEKAILSSKVFNPEPRKDN